LHLDSPVATVHGERFILRDESPAATVGGGVVLQPTAGVVRPRDLAAIDRLDRLRSPDASVRLLAARTFHGPAAAIDDRMLCRDAGVAIGEIAAIQETQRRSGALVRVGRRGFELPAETVADLEARVLRALARLHQASPRLASIGRARLVAELAYLDNEPLAAGLIDGLAARGELTADGRGVALRGHKPRLSQGERALKSQIEAAFLAGGLNPPELSTWTTPSNTRAGAVRELLALLCDEERLVTIGPDFYLPFDVAAEMKRRVATSLHDGSSLTMAELRDLLGTTRKYAVPIGEYLDRIGLTVRDGDVRRLLSAEVAGPTP
jgi:selenocysteine-specific elongation factor